MTLTATTEPALAAVGELERARRRATWTVKDSFAALALEPAGFRILFTAEWIARPAACGETRRYRAHAAPACGTPTRRSTDFFAGSGTLAEAAAKHGRDFLLVDDNPEAIAVMARRLAPCGATVEGRDGAASAPLPEE